MAEEHKKHEEQKHHEQKAHEQKAQEPKTLEPKHPDKVPEQKPLAPPSAKVPEQKNLDWNLAQKVLQEHEDHAMTFDGKEGYNPHMYINKVIRPLQKSYNEGNRSEELFNTIIGLRKADVKTLQLAGRDFP